MGQDDLVAFYRDANVALVTPLRDGMNLVAKEFVASQDDENPGVLILSPFAGAGGKLMLFIVRRVYVMSILVYLMFNFIMITLYDYIIIRFDAGSIDGKSL